MLLLKGVEWLCEEPRRQFTLSGILRRGRPVCSEYSFRATTAERGSPIRSHGWRSPNCLSKSSPRQPSNGAACFGGYKFKRHNSTHPVSLTLASQLLDDGLTGQHFFKFGVGRRVQDRDSRFRQWNPRVRLSLGAYRIRRGDPFIQSKKLETVQFIGCKVERIAKFLRVATIRIEALPSG